MRLIDADEYAYFMKTYANGIRNVKPNIAEFLDVIVGSICEWPTAYDLDKVVEELEFLTFNTDINLGGTMVNRNLIVSDNAINIVKAGGKDE